MILSTCSQEMSESRLKVRERSAVSKTENRPAIIIQARMRMWQRLMSPVSIF